MGFRGLGSFAAAALALTTATSCFDLIISIVLVVSKLRGSRSSCSRVLCRTPCCTRRARDSSGVPQLHRLQFVFGLRQGGRQCNARFGINTSGLVRLSPLYSSCFDYTVNLQDFVSVQDPAVALFQLSCASS